MSLIKTVKKTIHTGRLCRPGDCVLLGVSGGPDSVALLSVFDTLRHELGIRLVVAHVNHQLRKSASTDERFVQKLCAQWQVPCHVIRLTPPRRGKYVSEDAARQQRLKSLIAIATKENANAIALAHHQDDLAETVLMRVIRGSGLKGLQGILPKRRLNGMLFIRPLIHARKAEIERYLKTTKTKFRRDPTNRQTRFLRNKLRQELLPLLEQKYNPNIKNTLSALSQNATMDYDYLYRQANRHLKRLTTNHHSRRIQLSLPGFSKLHPSLQRLVMRLAIEQLQGNMNRLTLTHLREVEDLILNRPPGSVVDLPAGIAVEKKKGMLALSARST